ncbi:MAG TPA: glycine cleavage system protein H [Candidatus Saccharimonadales bacterium]|nr:glycine cleavage system protein H [Candidatus Saccharimonadales bacterium]
MTAIFVVATIVVLLTLDWLHARRTEEVPAVQSERAPALAPVLLRDLPAGGFELRENLGYHPAHTWAFKESPGLVRVGMDDFAARLLGSLESIDLPRRGQWVRQGQRLAVAHRDGATVELVSPMEGIVADVNDDLARDAGAATEDPYGAGWLITVQAPDLPTSFRNLLKGSAARSWMVEASERLRGMLPAPAGAVAQDGGLVVRNLAEQLPDEEWARLAGEFLGN